MSGEQARMLVALSETGYFRLYGSTILEMERRGWDVLLAFDRPQKRGEVAQIPAGAGRRVRSLGAVPDVARTGPMAALRTALDYLRYLEPRFAGAAYLRRRSESLVPAGFAWMTRLPGVPRPVVSAVVALFRALERLVPPDDEIRRFLAGAAPDVVFVSPLVSFGPAGGPQTELVKAARRLGIPAVVGVASWDHLTSKGLLRVVPDLLTVWNDAQRREAIDLHRVPAGRIVVSGAQSLDHWFEPVDPHAAARLRGELGLDAGRKVVLFVGSSRNMAPGLSEVDFVRRWLQALRASTNHEVRGAQVVVRPHPSNVKQWQAAEAGDLDVRVHPASYSGIPMSDEEVEAFRQSLVLSDAVVGVNTTAMIEAAILGRPVLTVRDGAFAHSQNETLHFAHLVSPEGCAVAAESLDEHVDQLASVLKNPSAEIARSREFVQAFVRPLGLATRATEHLCDAIERVAPRAASVAAREPDVEAGLAVRRSSR